MILFQALDLIERMVTGRNLHFAVYGKIFLTNDPLQFDVNDVELLMDYTNEGFVLEVMCNYPEAYLNGEVKLDNWRAYYIHTRFVRMTNAVISHTGPGNITMTNFVSEITNEQENA